MTEKDIPIYTLKI